MKSIKIIKILTVITILISCGIYFNLQSQSQQKVIKISRNATSITNAMDWKEDVDNYLKYNDKTYLLLFDTTISNIYSSNLLFKHGYGDKDNIDALNNYYKEIADYLGVSTDRLDELNKLGSNKRIIELTKILSKK